ncbi:UDP-2,3-diacylglucosamine diphosphatase [Limnobacter parvus]|uniref:UDP-2,3-diacylglucosamine hydrolase n=1 Tax=Limnobacter parvus TaxID=2939690 RepID=A0ABT1XH77_9BURK|nr:UDP-2,3-diacylglucosamine diphosphatase [Limnobacter parvus]MCR2746651.1 UDP-2,3-diacylglucosamine diphosphatase [Limnobacter parvus]
MIEIPQHGAAFFASDLHLSEHTPHTLDAFENWLASVSQDDALIFLLGDLFEVWYGDDYSDATSNRVVQAIQSAKSAGAKVYFMHGNRDFLIGETFAEAAGLEILPDPEFLLVKHHVVLITHGDQLCTDDKPYQKFRTQSRDEKWQANFLALPLEKRIETANSIRTESKAHKANSALSIMDANTQTVAESFQGKWPDGYYIGKNDVILHGHTHRCAIHPDLSSKAPTKPESTQGELLKGLRIVLPDWNFDNPEKNRPKGGFLKMLATGEYSLNLFS